MYCKTSGESSKYSFPGWSRGSSKILLRNGVEPRVEEGGFNTLGTEFGIIVGAFMTLTLAVCNAISNSVGLND